MAKRYWHIRGYKKFDTILDVTIPVGCLTDSKLKDLLRCLTAKADASFDDIVGAYLKRKTIGAHNLFRTAVNGSFPRIHVWI